MTTQQLFDNLSKQIQNCRKCELCKTRTLAVVGEGKIDSRIMFIGEAPGHDEDQSGIPFVGAAGQILNELFAHVGIDRRKIFIANILKCRPPKNADPTPDQIKCCSEYLDAQISMIKPVVICTMGNFATSFILEKYGLKAKIQGITKIKGNIFKLDKPNESVKYIIPLLHPAVATYNASKIDELKKDFEVLLSLNLEEFE